MQIEIKILFSDFDTAEEGIAAIAIVDGKLAVVADMSFGAVYVNGTRWNAKSDVSRAELRDMFYVTLGEIDRFEN